MQNAVRTQDCDTPAVLNLRLLGIFGALTLLVWTMVPVLFLSPATAFGAGGSASDSQYQDPLAGATNTAPAQTFTRSGAVTSTSTSTSSAVTTATATSSGAATVTSTVRTSPSSGGVRTVPSTLSPTAPASIDGNPTQPESLPMTGLNVEGIAFVGLMLVAGGFLLRWRTSRPLR
jgi:LPXTG-motif cell wall-anchored protein